MTTSHMRYALIKHASNGEYDLIDYKRNRVSSVSRKTMPCLIEAYTSNYEVFWFTSEYYNNIHSYLQTNFDYTTICTFESIKQLITDYPEYFI